MSASSTPPVINEADIANYGIVAATDKWFDGDASGFARGQSITTGGAAVRLKSISYQVSEGNGAAPTKTYTVRVGKIAGVNFTQVHSETASQNFAWTSEQFMTWRLDTPVLLEPYTTYGIDVQMTGSTSGWTEGIAYINVTADEYAGGTSYTTTPGGLNSRAINSAIASDRIFHMDIEHPFDPVFSLVVPSPADNSTGVFASREIIMIFSQAVSPGTGNFTIRNLTDNTSTTLAANDSRLIYDQNAVRLNPLGLITWSKNYAIRYSAGTFLGNGGAPIPAIADDTTWNFSTAASDPLLSAIAAIKAHVITPTTLTGPQISAHKTTIDDHRQRFAESNGTVSAVLDLITTYDSVRGPLFVSGSTVTSFDRNTTSISPENYHWVIYTIMQHTMDLIYTTENVPKYESILTNYRFGSHASFPGTCTPPANPLNTHSVQINGSFPASFGRNTQMWTTPARKPTGTYLAPGTIATVTVPQALVNAGYKIRVCAHSWDLSARRPVNRLERASRLYNINSTVTKIASPYGGGIYIEVPHLANAGVVSVTVTGGVRSSYFSAKSFHQTTTAEWDVERTHLAPWVDFQSEKFMVQVPRKWIFNMTGAQAVQLMIDWDKSMDSINDLMGFPRNRGKETMYCQTDVILRSAVHAPGYPAINVTSNVNSDVSPLGYAGNYLVRGPNSSLTGAAIEFHEQGHAYGFPKFGGENESTVNLLQPAMLNRAFGRTFDEAQNGSFGSGNINITMDNSAIAWMTVFNFSPREAPMHSSESSYQHKGHAKWMDVARIFGWETLDAYWRSFQEDDANNISYGTSNDDMLLRLSKAARVDIRPLLHFWGTPPQNPTALASAIAAANLPTSNAIRLQLLRYKNIVPSNNAAFRTFATAWRGKQPSINGQWEEREHARQWDTAALYGVGDQQRSEATNPGEIYNENSANDIRNRIDELVGIYYPGAIAPNPMTFAITPAVVNATTVGMVATTATAGTGPVEYFFDETSGNPGGTDSAWQTSPTYQDTGLTSGITYTYRVSARGGPSGQPTDPSAAFNVTITASGDVSSPTPSPMTFFAVPAAVDQETITMTATAATDISGVEYYFENTTNNTNSGWQNSNVYTETNLQASTSYTYRVRARDKSPNQNATAFSATAIANTGNLPDVTFPQAVTFSPANLSIVSNLAANLVITFDEPIILGSGSITLKNLTDGNETVFIIGDSAITISGNTLTLNPPSDLLHQKTFAIQITNGIVSDAASNPYIGISDDNGWRFSTVLGAPIVNTGGPYVVSVGSSLSLNGSAIPSTGATIASSGFAWDLNRDSVFGDVTGPLPASLTDAVLMSTYGMVVGQNNVRLRVTDSMGQSTIASTIVKIGANLGWDANGASANQTDGAAAWFDANRWREGTLNSSWIPGSTAVFGVGGNGGNISLGASTPVGALVFNAFNGTYSFVGGGTLTVNNGFTNNSNSGALSFATPIILGGAQTWGGTSTGALTFSAGINTNGHLMTIGTRGTINMNATANIISGGGGLMLNGLGRIILGGNPAPVHTYTGPTTISGGGSMMISGNLPAGNLTINGGYLDFYFGGSFTRSLGTGNSQVSIPGGISGFSNNGSTGANIRFNNDINTEIVWGNTHFNPSTLVLQENTAQNASSMTLENRIDLNGSNRTIFTSITTGNATGSATISNIVRNSSTSSPAGLVKTGSGRLNLNGANTYNGGTTIQAGTLQIGNATALGSTGGSLTINGGLLNLNDQTVSVGNLTGTGGTIGNNASGARTLTIGSGNATGGNYQGIIANRTGTGTGSLAVTKTGSGTIALSGLNSYTGATMINGGNLTFTGATQATSAITFAANSSLGLVVGSPVTASSAAVNFTNGRISVTGTPTTASHRLLTASSFTGTPVLAAAVPGYELAVVGNELRLNQVISDPYLLWAAGAAIGADANNDGVANGMAWVLGAANPNASIHGLMPTLDLTSDPQGKVLFIFRRVTSAMTRPNTITQVEYTHNFASWTAAVHQGSAANQITITEQTNGFGAGIDRVTVALPKALANGGKIFARLKTIVANP
jgi:autotransporter-associated beta strand protein